MIMRRHEACHCAVSIFGPNLTGRYPSHVQTCQTLELTTLLREGRVIGHHVVRLPRASWFGTACAPRPALSLDRTKYDYPKNQRAAVLPRRKAFPVSPTYFWKSETRARSKTARVPVLSGNDQQKALMFAPFGSDWNRAAYTLLVCRSKAKKHPQY
jgi:hypothetical protein